MYDNTVTRLLVLQRGHFKVSVSSQLLKDFHVDVWFFSCHSGENSKLRLNLSILKHGGKRDKYEITDAVHTVPKNFSRKYFTIADILSQKKISLILRNIDSSRLYTSHLKFECEFSKEPVFEAEQLHLINNNAICPALPQYRHCSWQQGLNSKNFLDLFSLVHFPEIVNKNAGYDRGFSLAWICVQWELVWRPHRLVAINY